MADWINVMHWQEKAKAGEIIIYYRGFLAADKMMKRTSERAIICGSAALLACDKGMVNLYQKRIGDGHYLYIAEKKGPKESRR